MTGVAETAVIDHGSHDIDIPIKGHFQEAGQPRWAKLRLRREALIQLRNRGEGGVGCRVKGPATTGGGRSEFLEAGAVEGGREAKADWEKEQ